MGIERALDFFKEPHLPAVEEERDDLGFEPTRQGSNLKFLKMIFSHVFVSNEEKYFESSLEDCCLSFPMVLRKRNPARF